MTVKTKESIRERIVALPTEQQQQLLAQWPKEVPSLKTDGHTDEQLRNLSALVKMFEDQLKPPAPTIDRNRARVHGACTAAFENDNDLRHALLAHAGINPPTSSGLTDQQTDIVCDLASKVELGMLVVQFADDGKPFFTTTPTLVGGSDDPATAETDEAAPPAADGGAPPLAPLSPSVDTTGPADEPQDPIDWRKEAKLRGVTQAVLLREIAEWCPKVGADIPKTLAGMDDAVAREFLKSCSITSRPDLPAEDPFDRIPDGNNPGGRKDGYISLVPGASSNDGTPPAHVVAPNGSLIVVHLDGSFVTGYLDSDTTAKVLETIGARR